MSTPSTVWAQLSTPNSPVGSVTFVGIDGTVINTDVANFKYTGPGGDTSGTNLLGQLTLGSGLRVGYQDKQTTPGNVTINEVSGRVTIPAGSSFITVTNSKCFGVSLVFIQLLSADATLTRIVPVAADGVFTLSGNAAATANVVVQFFIVNPVT